MDFVNVKEVTIPDGSVSKITETATGRVLWEKKIEAEIPEVIYPPSIVSGQHFYVDNFEENVSLEIQGTNLKLGSQVLYSSWWWFSSMFLYTHNFYFDPYTASLKAKVVMGQLSGLNGNGYRKGDYYYEDFTIPFYISTGESSKVTYGKAEGSIIITVRDYMYGYDDIPEMSASESARRLAWQQQGQELRDEAYSKLNAVWVPGTYYNA